MYECNTVVLQWLTAVLSILTTVFSLFYLYAQLSQVTVGRRKKKSSTLKWKIKESTYFSFPFNNIKHQTSETQVNEQDA
jgi:hypothetical protein